MANNVDININAKGAATASKGLRGVASAAKKLDNSLDGLSVAAKAVQASFAPLLAVVAAYKAVTAVSDLISSSNEAFLTQAEAARGATEAQKAFASELQRTLGIGDEVTLGIMQQAKALGIAEDQMEEATKAAIGISEATGEGINESLKKVNRALNGSADAFNEVIPGLSDMATEQEKLAAINGLVARGLEKQSAKMEGLQGIQTRASNSLGDLMEVFGEILAPIRAVISQGIAVFAEVMQQALVPAVDLANAAMKQLPVVFEFTKKVIISAVAGIETVVTNFPKIVQLASLKAQLSWVALREGAKHTFTKVIPDYLKWFKENLPTILRNGVNAASTIVQNYFKRQYRLYKLGFKILLDSAERFAKFDLPGKLWDMAGKALEAVKDMFGSLKKMFKIGWANIKAGITGGFKNSGKSLTAGLQQVMDDAAKTLAAPPGTVTDYAKEFSEIMSSSLLEGFEAEKLTSLPEIIRQQLTDEEKSLQAQIGKLGEDLAKSFNGNFEKYAAQFKNPAQALKAALKAGLITPGANAGGGSPGESDTALSKSGGSAAGQLQAVQGRLLTRGPVNRQLDVLIETTKQVAKNSALLRDIRDNTKKGPPNPSLVVNRVGLT